MKNVYILDDYKTSVRNGIGTYLQELLACLKSLHVFVWTVKFNSPEPFFRIKTGEEVTEMHFPPFTEGIFLSHHKIIEKFFRLHITDSPDNLFMVNHSPCENLLKALKTAFPLSKLTFTIHDSGWQSLEKCMILRYLN